MIARKVAGTQEFVPVPFQLSSCMVKGHASDKNRLSIRVPWHDLKTAVVYDLTLAVTKLDGNDARVVDNELISKKDAVGKSGRENWEILNLRILPDSRQFLPDSLKKLSYGVSASLNWNGLHAKILVLLQGK